MDFFQPAPNPNKERYELMLKRRQALLELAKLKTAILRHSEWSEILRQDPTIEQTFEKRIFHFDENLCKNFCQANSDTLSMDIQNIYVQIVCLAKVWVALEAKQSVIDLLIAT